MVASDPPVITVYTLPTCVHCVRAKALLARRSIPYEEVDVSGVPRFRHWLEEQTGGSTVPQIVIDGIPIGGANRLAGLDRRGILTAIAKNEQFPIAREQRRISPHSLAQWAAARLRGQRGVSAVQRVEFKLDRAGRIIEAPSASQPGDPRRGVH